MPRTPVSDVSCDDQFKSFSTKVKLPKEGLSYDEMKESPVEFNAELIKLLDPDNIDQIIIEMNNLPQQYFKYRMLIDMQTKIVQQLEDEYSRWFAKKWIEIDSEMEPKIDKSGNTSYKKIERTEGAKEKIVMSRYEEDHTDFQSKIREEKYKLSLIKSATAAIDSYSFKLHSILSYKQASKSTYGVQ